MENLSKTKKIALAGMFGAIVLLLGLTPVGLIPLPIINATTLHIPVIVGALILGPKYGAFLGFLFGLTSLMRNTFTPGATSFVFSPFIDLPGTGSGSALSLLVVFLPRILVGVLPWFAYAGLKKILPEKLNTANYAVAGVVGAMTNTLLVMHFIFFFFGETWNAARAEPADVIYTAILGIIAANGIPEAIAAGILVPIICGAISLAFKRS
jgi:uncharacterized membrane protein